MKRLGPFYYQHGAWGLAFALGFGGFYYCVELRRDKRHR